jgi:malate dehydrogenase (oxaloacetate-decarboxylating)
MEVSACHALANIVGKEELKEDYIIPNIFNKKVASRISKAVIKSIR